MYMYYLYWHKMHHLCLSLDLTDWISKVIVFSKGYNIIYVIYIEFGENNILVDST